MKAEEALPRDALIWLLVAQVLVIAPHLAHLPGWVDGLWLLCVVWRIQIFRMRLGYPRMLVKIPLIAATGFAVYLSRGGLVGLEAGAVLLICAFILKLLEMRSRRDGLVVVFLGFFTVLTGYLFEDGLLAALYSLLPVLALIAALIALHQTQASGPWPALRQAGGLLLQAVPMMLVLFLFFPRLGPLWSMPAAGRGFTGLAESMSPGDMSELGQSPELAFRVSFEGPAPSRENLYWRAITFERFDGRRWLRGYSSQHPQLPHWVAQGEPLTYNIVMQPSGQPWLFALDVPQIDSPEVRLMGDFHLERSRPVDQPLLYRVTSWPVALREPGRAPEALSASLQLPLEGNPRSRAWAAELSRQEAEPERLVARLLEHFNREPYVYSLKPPRLGDDFIDEFLFDSRNGFCMHYAGAMAFVLRAAGIPARVVGGYQGGELNPAGNYWLVHQFDAHAWVEYWQPGRGWVSVDPTFQVAPERVRLGLEQALASRQEFLEDAPVSLMHFRTIGWVNQLRFAWDNLNYGWQRWVLGYQGEQQKEAIRRWLGDLDMRSLGLTVVAGLALLLGGLALMLLRPWQREVDLLHKRYMAFERLLARHGMVRQTGEGPRAFAERAAAELPRSAAAIRDFSQRYERLRYGSAAGGPDALRQPLRRLRRTL